MRRTVTAQQLPHVLHVGLYPELFRHVDVSQTRVTAVMHQQASRDLPAAARDQADDVAAVDVPHRLNNNDYDDYYPLFETAARALSDRWGEPNAVVGLYEHTVVPAARLRQHFGLPGLSLTTALGCRDKVRMKRLVADAGVLVPRFLDLAAAGADELSVWLGGDAGPWVLKPKSEGGAIGVQILQSQHECAAAVAALGPDRASWELEEFIQGDIHHVDAVVRHGRLIFSMLSRYVGTCHDAASRRRPLGSITVDAPDLRASAEVTAGTVLAALGLEDAVVHLELFRRGQDWVFLEIACRHGGVAVVDHVRHVFGVNLIKESYLANVMAPTHLAELSDPTPVRRDGGGCSGWLIIPMQVHGPHIVEAVEGPQGAAGIFDSSLPQVGDVVDDAFRPFPTLGAFLFSGADEAALLSDIEAVVATFKADLTPAATDHSLGPAQPVQVPVAVTGTEETR